MTSMITQTLHHHTKAVFHSLSRLSPISVAAINTLARSPTPSPTTNNAIENSLTEPEQKESAQNTHRFAQNQLRGSPTKTGEEQSSPPNSKLEKRIFQQIMNCLKRTTRDPHVLVNSKVTIVYPTFTDINKENISNILSTLEKNGFKTTYENKEQVNVFTVSLLEKNKEDRNSLKKQLCEAASHHILNTIKNPNCNHTRFILPQEYLDVLDDLMESLEKKGFFLTAVFQYKDSHISKVDLLYENENLELPDDEPLYLEDYTESSLPAAIHVLKPKHCSVFLKNEPS